MPFANFKVPAGTLNTEQKEKIIHSTTALYAEVYGARARAGATLPDPLAERLSELGRACTGDPAHDVGLFLGLEAVFPRAVAADPRSRTALERGYGRLTAPTSTLADN